MSFERPSAGPAWDEAGVRRIAVLPAAATNAAPTDATNVQPPAALYVHVPFCVSLCPYCDFVVYSGSASRGPRNRLAEFVAALRTEIELRADDADARFGPRPPVETVYFGGGTPSLLPAETIADLIELVGRRFGLATDAEITIEANPGPNERGDLAGVRQAGVTRVSFGAQSFDPGELQRLGRRHRPEDIAGAVALARAAGFRSVNVDLLYDVPGQTVASWVASLDAALGLAPDHLSLYALTLDDPDAEGLTGSLGDHLPARPGARRWRERARRDQDEDRAAEQYGYAVERLDRDGWRGYELSNWSCPGHECRHNLIYWQRRPYEAVGPGAHAFDGETRRWNAARLDAYVAALRPSQGFPSRLPPGGKERLDATTAAAEAVILGLRTDTGVARSVALAGSFAPAFEWARSAGLVEESATNRISLTTRGRLLSNELFARLV